VLIGIDPHHSERCIVRLEDPGINIEVWGPQKDISVRPQGVAP